VSLWHLQRTGSVFCPFIVFCGMAAVDISNFLFHKVESSHDMLLQSNHLPKFSLIRVGVAGGYLAKCQSGN